MEEITESEAKRVATRIKNLAKIREDAYDKIKNETKLFILKLISDGEKTRGYESYWELHQELEEKYGIVIRQEDYERIIEELEENDSIEYEWSGGTGGVLRIKK